MTPVLPGVHIVVTRASHQAEDLACPLRELGALITFLPTVEIAPPVDTLPLSQAAASIDRFDFVVFTSSNAVHALGRLLGPLHRVPKAFALGPVTHSAALALGFEMHELPDKYVAESLAEALAGAGLKGKRILVPGAARGRDIVPNELRRLGAEVVVVEAYRNVCPASAAVDAPKVFRLPLPDWVLFASPSAFKNLLPLVDANVLRQVRLGSIGPTTSAAILACGFEVSAEANPQTVTGLVEAVVRVQTQN